MGLNSDSYYVIGESIPYTSIYGYPKRRFAVYRADESGNKLDGYSVGEIKEEPMLDENGELWGRCFYTKNLGRPTGKYRFYPSPEALIVACGGKVLGKPATQARPGQNAKPAPDPDVIAAHPIRGDAPSPVTTGDKDVDDKATMEARLKALEDKVFLGPVKTRKATSRRSPAKKPARKAAKKVKSPPPRKKKVTY